MRRAARARGRTADRLVAQGAPRDRVEAFLDVLPPRLFLDHSVSQLTGQIRSALAFLESGDLVGVYPFRPEGDADEFWGIAVFAQDRTGLFSQVAGVLASCGHNILAAHVYTTRTQLAIEIYQVDPIPGGPGEEALEVEQIQERLHARLSGQGDADVPRPRPRIPARPRGLRAPPPTVRITNQDSDFYSIVDVSATDRPALLYDITRTLSELGLEIVRSRAATRADRVIDAFYVTDRGHKVLDPERQREVEERVLRAIREESAR